MKKKQIGLATASLAVLWSMASCSGGKQYTIEGSVDKYIEGDTSYVYMLDLNGEVRDSVLLTDGSFELKGTADSTEFVYLSCNEAFCFFVLEPGTIKVEMGDENCTVKGTEQNERITNFQELLKTIETTAMNKMEQIAPLYETDATLFDSLRNDVYFSYYNDVNSIIDSVYSANPANMLGVYIMGLRAAGVESYAEMLDLLKDADPFIVNSPFIQQRLSYLKENPTASQAVNGIEDNQHFIDFKGLDSKTEKPVSLSDYVGKGKPVLVDFWASWCGPCRQEIPYIKALAEKYKGKIEVVGVGIGDALADHKKAIQELGITWPQIYDENEDAAQSYNVQTIPYIVLFDGEGNVYRQNIRGEQLDIAVQEVLK